MNPIIPDPKTPAESLAAAVVTVLDHHGCLDTAFLALSGELRKTVHEDLVDVVTGKMKELGLSRVARA